MDRLREGLRGLGFLHPTSVGRRPPALASRRKGATLSQPLIIHGKRASELSPRHGRPQCALWGVTRANTKFWGERLTDWTEWLDIHPLIAAGKFPGIPERRPETWAWFRAQDGTRPIWLMGPDHHKDPNDRARAADLFAQVPGAAAFPMLEIQEHFKLTEDWGKPAEPSRWFICQTGMMIAFALMRGFAPIVLNGIGMSNNVEHMHLHRDIIYWMGVARGRGVDVIVEHASCYRSPTKIYSYGELKYAELEEARRQARGPRLADLEALEQVNERERRRGRPVRHRTHL